MQASLGQSIDTRIGEIEALVARSVASPQELESILRRIYHALFDVSFAGIDRREATEKAPFWMQRLFSIRTALRDKISVWQSRGFLPRPTEIALRDAFRILRYAVDMLGELALGNAQLAPDAKPRRAFSGRDHNTHVHALFYTGRNIAFRSGDVLLVRGSAHNSAAIARVGDVDTVFSHTAIIHIDAEGKHWVVEALIEDGAVINTLEHVLEHGVARAVLYRFKNAEIAARAAELAYARIRASEKGWGRHIPYDFSMRLSGRRRLFCAKLVRQAFLDATGGKVAIPAFMSRFDLTNPAFFKGIGVRAKETYAPGDIDLDPRFDLVAEWQDYRATSYLRRQDMVMTKFFEWMETKGYRFKPNWLIRLVSIFGRLSSHLSDGVKDLLKDVIPKVPRNMPRRTIATIAMLHKSAETVMPALAALDQDHIRMTGLPIHPRELLAHLERLREVSGGRIGFLVRP